MTLYVTDLDGTLLGSDKKIKPRGIDLLNLLIEKGVMITFATARGHKSAYDLTKDVKFNLPVILMNGVITADFATGEMISGECLSKKQINFAKKYCIENNESPLVYSFMDKEEKVSYLKNDKKPIRTYLNDRKGDKRFRPVESFDELFKGEIYYICLINHRSDIEKLLENFSEKSGFSTNYQPDSYNENEMWFEIFGKDISKGNAIKKLQASLGADKVVVFGDNVNDISMFMGADEGYAVRNACDELKKIATDIIMSNNNIGVPTAIERLSSPLFQYEEKGEIFIEPDFERFDEAKKLAGEFETAGIGTLNEKMIHRTLKYYYSDELNHEAKIGQFYADIVSENGIIEIQSGSWGSLNNKLSVFLDACHVTVVYPFERRTKTIYIHKDTGEVIKTTNSRDKKNYSRFMTELYRIKTFLTNPNLTIIIAELEVEKKVYVKDERCHVWKSTKKEKRPLNIIREIYLEKNEDFRIFMPSGLSENFTKKDFMKLSKPTDGSILLEIMNYFGFLMKIGKSGNEFIYKLLT